MIIAVLGVQISDKCASQGENEAEGGADWLKRQIKK